MTPHLSDVETAISAVTLIASILSLLGSGFILVCYAILPIEYHFRCILILNLAVSDFLTSLTTTIGGIEILARRRDLDPGPGCILQGFVMQISATDCAVMAIAIATVFIITKASKRPYADDGLSLRQIMLSSGAIWAFPFFTGFLALGMGWYAPASGNWCWIVTKPTYLRYVLMHGWKMVFIAVDICLYVYLYIWIRRHYESLAMLSQPPHVSCPQASSSGEGDDSPRKCPDASHARYPPRTDVEIPLQPATDPNSTRRLSLVQMTGLRGARQPSNRLANNSQYNTIRKMLLLNAYPLAYIILWLPGIANRLIEATGHSSSVTQMMQASTQLVGLANALTYGWNEGVATQVRKMFAGEKRVGWH